MVRSAVWQGVPWTSHGFWEPVVTVGKREPVVTVGKLPIRFYVPTTARAYYLIGSCMVKGVATVW